MIAEYKVKLYCSGNIADIENYDKAVADDELVWHCHHRKECCASKEELIARGEYWKVPPADLIFMTPAEHTALHWSFDANASRRAKISARQKGNRNGANSKRFTERHHTAEARKKIGEASKGRKARLLKHVWDDKDTVLALRKQGLSLRKIAKRYGCSRQPIINILTAFGML